MVRLPSAALHTDQCGIHLYIVILFFFLCSLSAWLSVCRVGIRVVANAGGINLLACADMVKKVASEEGVDLSVAMVTGDDLMKKVSRVRVAIRQGPLPLLLNFFCCYFCYIIMTSYISTRDCLPTA